MAVGCIHSLQYLLTGVSCWLQGHFQIAMNRERCPLLQKRLSWGMRILYMSGVWSYIVGLTSTPTFIIIPLVSLSPNLSSKLPVLPPLLPPSPVPWSQCVTVPGMWCNSTVMHGCSVCMDLPSCVSTSYMPTL